MSSVAKTNSLPLAPGQAMQTSDEVGRQFAALCWRMQQKGPEVLLITSRDTGRWVVPKGWPMKGRSPSEAAAVEAWEEAGVNGQAETSSIGRFGYRKRMPGTVLLPCEVEVFSLRVDALVKDYPERKQRRRKWFSPSKAASKVAEPELRALILQFAADLQSAADSPDQDGADPAEEGAKLAGADPVALPASGSDISLDDRASAAQGRASQSAEIAPQGLTAAAE